MTGFTPGLKLEITPGRAGGPYGIEPNLAKYKANTLPVVLSFCSLI